MAEQELNGGVLGTLLGFSLPWKLLFDLPLVLHGSTPVRDLASVGFPER